MEGARPLATLARTLRAEILLFLWTATAYLLVEIFSSRITQFFKTRLWSEDTAALPGSTKDSGVGIKRGHRNAEGCSMSAEIFFQEALKIYPFENPLSLKLVVLTRRIKSTALRIEISLYGCLV